MNYNFKQRLILKKIEEKELAPQEGLSLLKEAAKEDNKGVALYEYTLKEKKAANQAEALKEKVLVFCKDKAQAEEVKETYLPEAEVSYVMPGEAFEKMENGSFLVRVDEKEDYVKMLQEQAVLPEKILFFWHQDAQSHEEQLKRSGLSISALTQAYMECNRDQKIQLLFIHRREEREVYPVYDGLEALFQTINSEDNRYQYKLICTDGTVDAKEIVNEFFIWDYTYRIEFEKGIRRQAKIQSKEFEDYLGEKSLNCSQGVYLIPGGAGGVGYLIAEYLAKKYQADIILAGRRKEEGSVKEQVDRLRNYGGNIRYYSVDMCNKTEVQSLVDKTIEEFGVINGVIYCAGMIQDAFLRNKTIQDMKQVIDVKLQGLFHLDECLAGEKIDYFAVFSSMSSLLGFSGQCDYAYANHIADYFAIWRERKADRYGKTLAVNWSLWKDSSMGIDGEKREWIEKSIVDSMGIVPMEQEIGIALFETALKSNVTQYIPIYGVIEKMKNSLFQEKKETGKALQDSTDESQYESAKDFVLTVLEKVLSIPKEKIDTDATLKEYGVDSIMVNRFNMFITETIKDIPQTLLFECKTVDDIIQYLLEHHKEELGINREEKNDIVQEEEEKDSMSIMDEKITYMDIAVIGLDVKAPGAENKEMFWENLKNGKDVITEIPKERWNNDNYNPDNEDSGFTKKNYCNWGGFVSGADQFDANFFNISPREARAMDPQERLLLQSVWHAFEDAGYSVSEINEKTEHNVGVFAGVTSNTYMLWGDKQLRDRKEYLPQSYPWSVANRISYILDFHGPCMAMDTACSSSLTAMHLACQSLKNKECETAVVGGVNLMLHPLKYIMQADMKMLSKTGHCYTFGENADGYVPSEGICSMILKPYKKALEDKDMIYGVIKSSAVNHGGTTTGYTVPNPNMQSAVIEKACERADINPRTISYVETHGTGTILGDPIEISALTKAYRKYTDETAFCGVGSVKSNMGHSESAAGVIAAAKVLLQLTHKQLVPSIHSEPANNRIDFKNSPFYVVNKLQEWKQPVVNLDKKGAVTVPLRAGISSFGAGGSNAHVIMEEDIYGAADAAKEESSRLYPIFKLSAKTETALKKYAENMLYYVEQNKQSVSFNQFLYTLQVARTDFDERLAFQAETYEDVEAGLKKFLKKESNDITLVSGNVRDYTTEIKELKPSDTENLDNVLTNWVKGSHINWSDWYSDGKRRRAKIPCYPFETKRFWIDYDEESLSEQKASADMMPVEKAVIEEKQETVSTKKTIRDIPIDFDTLDISRKLDLDQELSKFKTETAGDEVKLEIQDNEIAVIHLENRKYSNMVTKPMYYMLLKAIKQIQDTPSIKAVVITGYDNIFCMGGTKERLSAIADKKEACSRGSIIYKGLLSMRVPVITAMQGHALGGGFVFGLFGDIIVMAEDGMYSTNFMRYGFTPGVGSTYILKEKLGTNLALEMMYSAREYTGQELKDRGVSFVFKPASEVLEEAITIAKSLAKNPVKSLEVLKAELSGRTLRQLPYIIESEVDMHGQVFTQDSMSDIKGRIDHFFEPEKKNTISENTGNEKLVIKKNELQIEMPQKKTSGKIILSQKGKSREPMETTAVKKQKLNLKAIKETKPKQEVKIETVKEESKKNLASPKQKIQTVDVRKKVLDVISNILRMDVEDIDTRKSFAEIGVDSITGVEIIRDVNKELGTRFETVITYQFSDINSFIKYAEETTGNIEESILEPVQKQEKEEFIKQPEEKKETAAVEQPESDAVEKKVIEIICNILRLEEEEVDQRLSFTELGMDSVTGLELIRDINKEYGLKLEAVIVYDYKDIRDFIQMVKERTGSHTNTVEKKPDEEKELSKLLGDLKSGKLDVDQVDLCLEDMI